MVKLSDSRIVRRHVDHLQKRYTEDVDLPRSETRDCLMYGSMQSTEESRSTDSSQDRSLSQNGGGSERRYPGNIRKLPDRLGFKEGGVS